MACWSERGGKEDGEQKEMEGDRDGRLPALADGEVVVKSYWAGTAEKIWRSKPKRLSAEELTMPGVCAVLVSSESAGMTCTPVCRQLSGGGLPNS